MTGAGERLRALGLVVVTHDGEVLDLSEPDLDPLGYDLVGLLVGSEGMFGLVTEVTLRLTPSPQRVETLLAIFPSLDAACDAVSDVIAQRLEPSALEIISTRAVALVEVCADAMGTPKRRSLHEALKAMDGDTSVSKLPPAIDELLSSETVDSTADLDTVDLEIFDP